MEVIIPLESALAYTGSSPTYIYAVLVTATAYNAGDVRRYEVSTGVWRDFRCKIAHTSSASNAPGKTVYTWWWSTTYWDDLGPSSTSGGYTYTTNVRLSAYPAWATGAAVALNQAVYDAADNHDYIAVIAVSAGDNTVRPSDAINSADETLSARWLDLGASNAWAATDYLGNTYIEGYDASGNLVDPTLTVMLTCSSEVDRLCFAGLFNVKTLTTTVTDDGVARTATVTSLLPAGTTYGATHRTANIVLSPAVAAGSVMSVAIVLERNVATQPAKLGLFCAGRAHVLAETEWGLESSILSFSRKERDETFGTVTFIKRGTSRQIRATCFLDPAIITGDVVQNLLAQWDGQPIYWDFNAPDTTYDRLRVFGFYTNLRGILQLASWESLALDIEGLVE
jgi:hypothetical protein